MSADIASSQLEPKPSLLKRVIAICLMAGSISLLAIGLRGESGSVAKRDFIAYWSAGQLLVQHHSNPYDWDSVFALEKQQGYKEASATIMLNPPWAMIFVLPLGFVSAYVGGFGWILGIVACIMVSVRLLQRINEGQGSQDHLLAYAFAPVLACIMGGQMSGFACLALTLFLYWHKEKPMLAGIAASVLAIKPHLFAIFFLILLIDSIRKRKFRVWAGIVVGGIVEIGVPLIFDHHLLVEYLARGQGAGIGGAFIPTVSFLIRMAVNQNAFWIQFVPMLLAVVWSVWYYWRNRSHWEWNRQGLLLFVVSVWAAPYSTFLDELVLLPAVVAAILYLGKDGQPRRGTLPIYLALNGVALALLFAQVPVMSGAYIWTTTAWLGWYWYSA